LRTFHNFSHVKESETKSASDALVQANTGSAVPATSSGGASGSRTSQEQLISSQNANDLVELLSQMTVTIRNLEKVAQQITGYSAAGSQQQESAEAPHSTTGAAYATVGKLVSSVTSTLAGAAGSSSALDVPQLITSMDTLKTQHRRALSILEAAHVVNDQEIVQHLDRAESIAESDYQDAESGYAYDLDDTELSLTRSRDSDASSSSYGSTSSSGYDSSSSADESGDESDDATFNDASSTRSDRTEDGKNGPVSGKDVKRRTKLPAPVGEEVSMFGLLKKNMGKDLSRVSMPVAINEPLSALQNMAEALEYSELLDAAAKSEDSIERLVQVSCFAISTYAKFKYRTSRKPFNPLLGETYELVRPDKGFKFVAEKVLHHPNWTACYAQGRGWEYTATSSGAQKFWGRSFELIPEGISEVRIKDTDEVFTWTRPPSYVKNIMSGEKYVEHIGDLEVTNEETGERAVISFKEGSSWGGASSRNKIEGRVYDAHDSVAVELGGKWDESVFRKTGSKSSETLWQINDFPHDAPKYYGFSLFSMQLNELTPDLKKEGALPPTDSRLRPDQRSFENGKSDEAEQQKQALEEKQRERRKQWENANPGSERPPQFFKQGTGKEGDWKYAGGYWEAKEKADWNKDIQIFEM